MKRTAPTSLVWILIHSIVFLVGVIFFYVPSIKSTLGVLFSEALGGGLAATGAAGIFVYLYVRRSEEFSQLIIAATESGLTGIFEARAARIKGEYDQRLQKFHKLDVLGFGLSSFREDYKNDFARWAKISTTRILLIDPSFPGPGKTFSELRDREEKCHPGKIKGDVEQFLAETKELVNNSEHFQIRLMRCTPSINIFRVDNEIFFGPYLANRASRNNFTLICKEGGFLFSTLHDHFEAIWNSDELSTPVEI